MTHIDEGQLLAFADGELTENERRPVEYHLTGCGSCQAELAELRSASRLFTDAVGLLDRPAVRAGADALRLPRPRIGSWRQAPRALPRAAVLVLGFAAAASATLPGSPVRSWVEGLVEREAPREAPVAAVHDARVEAAADAPEAGVSVEPLDGGVRVVLRGAAPQLQVRALLTEGARAGVFATGGAAAARFQTGPGRIEVEGAGGGELRIELPRAARNAMVIVNGQEYLRKEGDQLRLAVGTEGRAAPEVSFRVRP